MAKKIIVISTSPRKGGNSETLADVFISGAKKAGNETEKVCLYDKTINFCRGCLVCQETQKCVIRDDMAAIIEKMLQADVVVFATPIYFYEMSGQMKTLLDRTNPLYPSEYTFRNVYLLATSQDDAEYAIDGAVKGLEGWIACFDKAKLSGVVRGTGADKLGDIEKMPEILEEAYQLGLKA